MKNYPCSRSGERLEQTEISVNSNVDRRYNDTPFYEPGYFTEGKQVSSHKEEKNTNQNIDTHTEQSYKQQQMSKLVTRNPGPRSQIHEADFHVEEQRFLPSGYKSALEPTNPLMNANNNINNSTPSRVNDTYFEGKP